MAFFDDLGKKISQAGQTVAQKTKDVTEVARLNGAILDEEKKINSNYNEIGKLFVKKFSDTDDAEFAALVSLIKESEEKIANYRRQVQDIKGVVRCDKCGAEVANGMAFCSACGNAMPIKKAASENTSVCKVCSAVLPAGTRFCAACGASVEQAGPVQKKVCPVCGVEVANDSSFCTACGAKL